jgi:hypothetical protein
MKSIKLLVILVLFIALNGRGQTCPNVTNIAQTNVCGQYGDAAGNSYWNWELDNPLDPNYCSNWYARTTSTGLLTRMGSPFVNPGSGKLKVIADNKDFTKAKGWELLQRKFGCQSDISNPYFILYNRISGMLRVFVYISNTSSNYQQVLMTIKSVNTVRPATLSNAKTPLNAPDKYLNNQIGNTNDDVLISINESVGNNNWSVGEIDLMFDHNIENSIYANGSLEITVYGVTSNMLSADLQGTSISSTNPEEIKDGVIKAKNIPSGGNNFSFNADGLQLQKHVKSITDFINDINKYSTNVATKLETSNDNVIKAIGEGARKVSNATSSSTTFNKIFSSAADLLGLAGTVLNFAGNLFGIMQGGSSTPAPSPTYTSYNLYLKGTITATLVVSKFIIKIPGTSAVATNANNATYYNIPLGIFNLKSTPVIDTLSYNRYALMNNIPQLNGLFLPYTAYRIKNDVSVVVNESAGLKIISVEGALVAKVDVSIENNGNPANGLPFNYLLSPYLVTTYWTQNGLASAYLFNHMRADILGKRLEVTNYDVRDEFYHTVQTPFTSLKCLKGLSMNLSSNAFKVFFRIRAILKRTDGTGEPIFYIKDYEVDKVIGNPIDIPQAVSLNVNALPPYANYTIAANGNGTIEDYTVYGNFGNTNSPDELKVNGTITNLSGSTTSINNQTSTVTYRAGRSITFFGNNKFWLQQ